MKCITRAKLYAEKCYIRESAQVNAFEIYNVIGELVISGKLNSQINTIDLSSLPPNVYLLQIENQSIKLIKTE